MKTIKVMMLVFLLVLSGCAKPMDLKPLANTAGVKAIGHVDDLLDSIWKYYEDKGAEDDVYEILPREALKVIGTGQAYTDILHDMSIDLDSTNGNNEDYRELISASINLLQTQMNLVVVDFEINERYGDGLDDLGASIDAIIATRNDLAFYVDEPKRVGLIWER